MAPRPKASYHHGDLRAALLAALGDILREDGVSDISFREVARRAGVSHAAPAHHFGTRTGLLTAYAALGFEALGRSMEDEAAGVVDPRHRLAAVGRGYVSFAARHGAQFLLMFRAGDVDTKDPAFVAANGRAHGVLRDVVAACAEEGHVDKERARDLAVAAWSLVHGLAALWIFGAFDWRARDASEVDALAARITNLFVEGVLGAPRPAHVASAPRNSARKPKVRRS